MSSKAVSHVGPSAVILLIYRPNQSLTAQVQCEADRWVLGWRVERIVRSVQAESSFVGDKARFLQKNKHLAPYNTHSGWSNAGAQRELLIWENLRARKIVEKSSPSERLPTQD